MLKQVWVRVIPWNLEVARAAIESGADALWVEPGFNAEAKKIGVIPVISPDGDLKLGLDIVEREVREKKDEEEIIKLSQQSKVIVKGKDWKIIPLENLLSRTKNIYVEVADLPEAQTALSILEKGVAGVIIYNQDPQGVRKIIKALKEEREKLELKKACIKRIEPVGLGDRVCVDTCSAMAPGEGMLIGNSSQALFLVHSESIENPFVNPRAFRVNAGGLHAYIRMAGGKTKYLAEIKGGDLVQVVNFEGKTYPAVVGRSKIEKRPLTLVEAEEGGRPISIILQNAETIRLTAPDGRGISLVDLKPNSEVLVYREVGARHFGEQIEETIWER
ncbi:MAG: 3-dehydroquinate synthase II [Thermodesulfobacteriota bacterium]